MIRKIGIESAIKILKAKVLDKKDGYRLLSLDIGDKRNRPYLEMTCPSTGNHHIEGCHPDVKTVYEALKWRNDLQEYYSPEEIT